MTLTRSTFIPLPSLKCLPPAPTLSIPDARIFSNKLEESVSVINDSLDAIESYIELSNSIYRDQVIALWVFLMICPQKPAVRIYAKTKRRTDL